ncbi:protein SMAX1-LIKE 7 isoform X2 [Morus notabilis]|uniref:protein SMAX1-LIKE 7 isoform X2 n=1 Tax=Morus notabilis TaxID=981085 RepID=UPI000CED26CE|nr:protein SMAX1-LIKE 7 isoform X2 [Morus notabilis]
MPTPVSVARQCLTPEAGHALDEAVAVARRRGHAQTTSLHAVSALLSLPSSPLRDACARARNSAYSPRLQFKALELCLGVSLDRVSSTQLADDPPVSNSLMAAIKRSQANQRRQPENYHLYHQIPQQSSIACVKVELQHLTLSILDDPVVSRVFGEAGFRSSEIKLAILRPFSQLLRYSRYRGPPVFLCNLTEYPNRSSGFAFPGFFSDGDGNCRRIGEILGRSKGRNPLLVGVCAYDALHSFAEAIQKRNDGVLPVGLSGINLISIEKDVSKILAEDCDDNGFGEVNQVLDRAVSGPGWVVNFGDLKSFVDDDSRDDRVMNAVGKITKLLGIHVGKVWLIGATASYESYLKFVSRFPSIEKDWDLQLLPITSLRSSSSIAEPYPSLMESFVPFGGFFSAPSDLKFPLSGTFQCPPRSLQCSDNCEQDQVSDVSKGGFTSSVTEQCQSSLPSWLQMAALSANKGGLDVKTKDGDLLNAKVPVLPKKWDNMLHNLHDRRPLPKVNSFPTIIGFKSAEVKGDDANQSSINVHVSSDETNKCMDLNSCVPEEEEKMSASLTNNPRPVVSKDRNESFSSSLWEKPSKDEDLESGGARSSPCSMSSSSMGDGNQIRSPASATSVTTDLGLGTCFSSGCKKLKKPQNQNHAELQRDISVSFSENVDLVNGHVFYHTAQSPSLSSPDNNHRQFDPRDVKMLFGALLERVGWQWEAISAISQTIVCHRTREKCHGAIHRGDIWLNFVGPDRSGKKKIASALAEVLYGNRENLICVDLNSQNGMIHSETSGYDVKFRGKTVCDYIAGEMCKKPLAVVFLENVDKSDVVVRNSLSQAISTGKFSDSYGREVSTNNRIFVTTSTSTKNHNIPNSRMESSNYSEERISKTKGRPLRFMIEFATRDNGGVSQSRIVCEGISNPAFVNKRKLIGVSEPLEQYNSLDMAKRAQKKSSTNLDLNLPAADNEVQHTIEGSPEDDSFSDNSEPWLQDFLDQVDETVVFKSVDFDALAGKIFKEIKNGFHKSVHSKCLLEIDSKVMEQLLAAVYFSDGHKVVEDWVEQVLSKGFSEIQKRHNLTAHSVVKLITCEGLSLEDQPPTVYLPSRIILN